jgi:nitroreductase
MLLAASVIADFLLTFVVHFGVEIPFLSKTILYMNTTFETLAQIINSRQTTKPAMMNGKIIPDSQIEALLSLADRAPTHARTEPWRFFVFSGEALQKFGQDHADMYWNNTAEELRTEEKALAFKKVVEKVSHLVIVVMRRTPMAKIPASEEFAATAAATQNILLGASAAGIAAIWNTGGMALKPAMKQYLDLAEEDSVMGLLYLGYTDEPAKPTPRNIPLTEKISWM